MMFRKNFRRALLVPAVLALLFINYWDSIYVRIYPVFRSMESQRLSYTVKDYGGLHYKDFYIRFSQYDGQALEELKRAIDSYGSKVYEYFDYYPNQPVEIILYSEEDEFYDRLDIPRSSTTLGAYYGNKLHIVSPLVFEDEYSDDGVLSNVFVHEFAHLVIDHLTRGNYPLWFTEGGALYMEYILLGDEWGQDIEEFQPFPIEELNDGFMGADENLAYKQSFLLIKEIIETYGQEKYFALLDRLGKGEGFSATFNAVLEIDIKALNQKIQSFS